MSYTYGTSGLTNGQVLTVTDGLSNITQTMGYGTSGTALGQVVSVSETDGSVTTSAVYTYNSTGDRSIITAPAEPKLTAIQSEKNRFPLEGEQVLRAGSRFLARAAVVVGHSKGTFKRPTGAYWRGNVTWKGVIHAAHDISGSYFFTWKGLSLCFSKTSPWH